jgi:hypothetical protein
MQHVEHVLLAVLLNGDHQAPVSARRHRGACVRRVAALRSGWLPVTTLGLSLTGRRSGPDGALGRAPWEQVAGSLYVIFAVGVLLLSAFADYRAQPVVVNRDVHVPAPVREPQASASLGLPGHP